jgi:hypothetical protein
MPPLPMRSALMGLGSGAGASGKLNTRLAVPFLVRPASYLLHHECQIAAETRDPRRDIMMPEIQKMTLCCNLQSLE